MYDDTKVFEQHHVAPKINNHLHWPGASYPGHQLTIKHGTTQSSHQYRVRSPRRHTDVCNTINTITNTIKYKQSLKLIDRRVDLTTPDIISSNREIPLRTGSSDTALLTVL